MPEIQPIYPSGLIEGSGHFLQLHNEASVPAARSRAAIAYTESMWDQLEGEGSLDKDPKSKSVSQLFVSSIKLFGTEELFSHYATRGNLHFKNYSGSLRDITEARNEVRDSISGFLGYHQDLSTLDKLTFLNGAMQDGARVIYGVEPTEEQKIRIGQQLNGLLAERKALSGLHKAGFIQSRFSTPEEDAFKGVDIYAAVNGYELPLQIRSTASKEGRLSIQPSNIPVVRVPTHVTRSPFNMKKPETLRLASFVASNLRPAA